MMLPSHVPSRLPLPTRSTPSRRLLRPPHVHHATYETHSAQAVITPVHTPVHAVSNEAVGVAQSVQHVGYAAHAVAPAVAHVGYAAGVAHAGLGLAGVSHAGFAHAGLGYAGLAAAAPVAALAHQYQFALNHQTSPCRWSTHLAVLCSRSDCLTCSNLLSSVDCFCSEGSIFYQLLLGLAT